MFNCVMVEKTGTGEATKLTPILKTRRLPLMTRQRVYCYVSWSYDWKDTALAVIAGHLRFNKCCTAAPTIYKM